MRVHPWHATVPVGLLILIPLLAFSQDQPLAKKQTPKGNAPRPRLDLYGDPLPERAVARMGTVRFRPGSEIAMGGFAISSDGKLIALPNATGAASTHYSGVNDRGWLVGRTAPDRGNWRTWRGFVAKPVW